MDNILLTASGPDISEWAASRSKKALVLMSGGVDSSAAALLLQKEGYSLAGLTMEISDHSDLSATKSAAFVCRELSIPHISINISQDFKNKVIEPFCTSYLLGSTPNPCADCNERIKFGVLWEIAKGLSGEDFFVATGHYARIINRDGRHYLAEGANKAKDQSYFLSGISPGKISRILLPLGDHKTKEETRRVVRSYGIPVSERSESMEICFADQDGYRSLFTSGSNPGPILDTAGRILGEHSGISGYTIGQRKGLGISAQNPLYVVSIIPAANTVVVASRQEAYRSEVAAERTNVLAPEFMVPNALLWGKVRSQGSAFPCRIISFYGQEIKVRFEKPVFAPAPGQRLVIYTAEGYVAAGGVIKVQDEMQPVSLTVRQ